MASITAREGSWEGGAPKGSIFYRTDRRSATLLWDGTGEEPDFETAITPLNSTHANYRWYAPWKTHTPLSTIMPSVLRKVFGRFRLCVPPRGEHGADKDLQPAQSVGRTQTPTPATEALVLELAEERARRVRLEQECQMTKVEANAFAEARTQKLEYEIREVRRLLEQRGEELGQKDASIQRLENEAIEVQAKVSQIGDGIGSDC